MRERVLFSQLRFLVVKFQALLRTGSFDWITPLGSGRIAGPIALGATPHLRNEMLLNSSKHTLIRPQAGNRHLSDKLPVQQRPAVRRVLCAVSHGNGKSTTSSGSANSSSSSSRDPATLQQSARQVASRTVAFTAAAAVAASAILSPAAVLPAAAHGHRGMEHNMSTPGTPGTMAGRFSCTPLTAEQRSSYFDLRGFSHPIHTASPAAQALFDQGLLMAYNFNHPEALRSFRAGLALDPAAAMLHWGVTYTLSPYANVVWGPAPADGSFEVITSQQIQEAKEAAAAGLSAAQSALAAAPGDAQLQAELRYATAAAQLWASVQECGDPAWFPALERYAKALESITADFPTDADAPALAAEARMNLSPWVHWKGPLGRRTPVKASTVVIPAFEGINTALQRQPRHPMASHLLIHLTEGGTPGPASSATMRPGYAALGEVGADVLAEGPAYPQMGHLTHMPSHAYLRTGRWHDAVASNKLALQADEAQATQCIEPYMPQHNASLLQFAAAMSGEYSEALALAQRQVRFPELFGPTNMADGHERAMLLKLYARWARWQELMQLDKAWLDYSGDGVMLSPGAEQYGDGVWHYTRALALASAASHEGDAAARASLQQQMRSELAGLDTAVAATPRDPLTRPGDGIGIYSPGFKRLGQIEQLTAGARVDVLDSNWRAAAGKLRRALAIDGSFGYTEPPRQYQPLKPCLGWVLLQQGRLREAEQVYLSDLADLPRNPWALRGLQQVYEAQATPAAAQKLQQVTADLAASWAHADAGLSPTSSCPAFSD